MSHGVAGVLTLYDDKGNPVKVKLVDGNYVLMATDERTHDRLDEIKVLLQELISELRSE